MVVKVTCDSPAALKSASAASLFETREIDPAIYDDNPNGLQYGTLTLTLNNGSDVTYSSALVVDSNTFVSPHTPGHHAIVYRPSDPADLQAFIDQYEDQTTSYTFTTTVALQRIGGADDDTSPVDTQGHDGLSTSYVGTVNTFVGSYERPGGEPLPK